MSCCRAVCRLTALLCGLVLNVRPVRYSCELSVTAMNDVTLQTRAYVVWQGHVTSVMSQDELCVRVCGLDVICVRVTPHWRCFHIACDDSLDISRFSSYSTQRCTCLIQSNPLAKTSCAVTFGTKKFSLSGGGTPGGSLTAVQAWRTCPLWEPSPSHPILVYTRGFAVFCVYMSHYCIFFRYLCTVCSFSTLIVLVGSFDL